MLNLVRQLAAEIGLAAAWQARSVP